MLFHESGRKEKNSRDLNRKLGHLKPGKLSYQAGLYFMVSLLPFCFHNEREDKVMCRQRRIQAHQKD